MENDQARDYFTPVAESSKESRQSHKVNCPRCGKVTALRSHRSGIVDYSLSLFSFYPYRCKECETRFFRFRKKDLRIAPEIWTRCPKCSGTRINRVSKNLVPRTSANFFGRMLSFPAYRCPTCRTKYFDFRPIKKDQSEKS